MFMLTAIGTAIILEDAVNEPPVINDSDEKFENVSYERLDLLYRKKNLLKKANDQLFNLDDDQWQFITTNQVKEIFPFLLKCYQAIASGQLLNITIKEFYDKLLTYVSAFSDEARTVMLYESIINETNERILSVLSSLINDTQLMDFNYVHQLLIHTDFRKQKIGLQLVTYNKPFYNADDIKSLENLTHIINENFKERGTKTTKKQMLSSKEKEVWICECGKTNDIPGYTEYCDSCYKDIYGFKATDITPDKALKNISTKIILISELIV
jgi:CDGSH-type Zn-finger protein